MLYKPVGSSDKYQYDFFILLYAEKGTEHLFPSNQVDDLITVLQVEGVKQSTEKILWEMTDLYTSFHKTFRCTLGTTFCPYI